MSVTRLHDKARPKHGPFRIDGEVSSPARQVARQQEFDTLIRQPLVRIEVLAIRVGVDRHLSGLASADRLDEIEGDHAALLASQLECRLSDRHLHGRNCRGVATPNPEDVLHNLK